MLLIELAAILVAAKLSGDLATRWGQPPVLGQLVAGLGLGLGFAVLRPGEALPASTELSAFAQIGVVLLMFRAGLETDWPQLRSVGRAATLAACAGVALPLAVGWATGLAFALPAVESLFVGVILTATSVSITAQTLMELGSLRTVEGTTVLGAAVIDDVIGLLVFSFAIAFTGAGASDLVGVVVPLGAFFLVTIGVGRRALPWLAERSERLRGAEAPVAIAIAAAFALAALAQVSGIAAITGAYVAGLLLNRDGRFEPVADKVRLVGDAVFVPIFLVKTGMDARIEQLGAVALLVGVLIAVAIVTKIIGCGVAARVAGLSTRQSLVVGVGMISRGEVAVIVAGLALSAGAITSEIFSAAVVVVLATTLVTPPLLRVALRGLPRVDREPSAAGSR
ncbi:MAG TPA: cation:proton antiporter [Candidatus Limnocylindria bacterium]